MEQNLTLSEITTALNSIQNQLDRIRFIVTKISNEDSELFEMTKKAEEFVRKLNIDDMNSHGSSSSEIVDWYWENYTYSAILVTTPNGNHPINYDEWTEGRIKNNKEVSPEFYKDFMIRVIDKGGYIQVVPF